MKLLLNLLVIFTFIQINGQLTEINKLKKAFINLKQKNNLNNQNIFFVLFPNSFENLTNTFGFKNGKESSIYKNNYQYIETFFQLDSIHEERRINKCIDISINGKWDADAVSFFQGGVRYLTFKKTELIYRLLTQRTDNEITSFFFFFFDSIHPEYEEIPIKLKEYERKDNNFYKLMQKGHKKALEKSGN